MKWYDNLFVGESIQKKANKIKWKINHNAGTFKVHIIALPSNENNLLDIIPARELLQKGYPKNNLYIIGLAGDYDEAVSMTTDIILETYLKIGTINIKEYLFAGKGRNI